MANFLHSTMMNIIRKAQEERSRGSYNEAIVSMDDLLGSIAEQSCSAGRQQPRALVAVHFATILVHQGYVNRAHEILERECKAVGYETRETKLLDLMFTYVRLRMNDITCNARSILYETWQMFLSQQWFGQCDETHVLLEIYWHQTWHSWRLMHNMAPDRGTLEAANRLGRLTCALADSGRMLEAVLVFRTQKLFGPDAPCPFRSGTLTGLEAATVCLLQGHVLEAENYLAFAEPRHLHGDLDLQLWKFQQHVEFSKSENLKDLEDKALQLINGYSSVDYPNGVLEVLSLMAAAERRHATFTCSPSMNRRFHEWGELTGQFIGLPQYPFGVPCMTVLLHRCKKSSTPSAVPQGQRLGLYSTEAAPRLPWRFVSNVVVPTSSAMPISMAREGAGSETTCMGPVLPSGHPHGWTSDSRTVLRAESSRQTLADPSSPTETHAEPSEYSESIGSYRKQEMNGRNSFPTNGRDRPRSEFSAAVGTVMEAPVRTVDKRRMQRHLAEGNLMEKFVDVTKLVFKVGKCGWATWRGDQASVMEVMRSLANDTPAWLRDGTDFFSMVDGLLAMENIESDPIQVWAQGKKLVDEAEQGIGASPIEKLFVGNTFQAFAYTQIHNYRKLVYHADLALSVQHLVDPYARHVLAPNLEFLREVAWVHTRYFVEDHILRDLTEYDIQQLHQSKLSSELKFNENSTLFTLKTQLCCLIAMICVILRDDEGTRKWLATANELAERLQPKHGLRKETVQVYCALIDAQAQQTAGDMSSLDVGTISEMRSVVENFERQREQHLRGMTKSYADTTDVQSVANLYHRLGCFGMKENGQATVPLENIHQARVDFNAGLGALELIDCPVRHTSYQNCLFGIAFTQWVEGFLKKDCTLVKEALLGFEELEAIVDELRSEQGPGAVSDFDNLRERRYFVGLRGQRRVYQDAVEAALGGFLFSQEAGEEPDWFVIKAWEWVQRQKARSVADLLSISGNLPETHLLAEDLQQHPHLRPLFQEEKDLVRMVQQAPRSERARLRRKLWLHRKRMTKEPLLAAEGLSFNNWASLSDLTVAGFKRVAFVDYFICQVANKVGLILIRTIPGHSEDDDPPFEIRFNMTNLTEKDINAWAQGNLNKSTLSDYDRAADAFDDLSALVKPLASLTAEGDVIVLCPTGPLHRLPLHALPIGGDNGEILLERNPVVYTSSLYSTIQFMRHRQKPASKNLAAVISAYETSNNENPAAEVLAVRNNLTALTTTLRCRAPVSATTIPTFKSLAESHSLLHFHGHTSEIGANGVHSALLLSSSPDNLQTLTMEQIMSWHLHHKNPLIINIACGSSTQDIQLGDEPLGLPTAWLIAGARAVVGTLWPIRSRDGRRFTEEFYGELESARRKGGLDGMVNLAVTLQKAALKMRDDEEVQASYHWAGFVLQGAWEMGLRE